MVLHDTELSGQRLQIQAKEQPSEEEEQCQKPAIDNQGLNNLYLKDLPKHVTNEQVRRAFARYGRISSFSLVDKP